MVAGCKHCAGHQFHTFRIINYKLCFNCIKHENTNVNKNNNKNKAAMCPPDGLNLKYR